MKRRELIRLLGGSIAGIPAVRAVERLDLKPRDTLVLKYNGFLKEEARARLMTELKKEFPSVRIMVLENGMDVAVIRSE
jgi:hypothetical protein